MDTNIGHMRDEIERAEFLKEQARKKKNQKKMKYINIKSAYRIVQITLLMFALLLMWSSIHYYIAVLLVVWANNMKRDIDAHEGEEKHYTIKCHLDDLKRK